MQQQNVMCTARGGPDLCGICGRQMPLGQVSNLYFVSDMSIILPPIFHIHSSTSRGMDTRPISGGQRDTGSHSNKVQSNVTLNKRVLTQDLESKGILHWFLVLLLHHWVGSLARENLPVLVASCSKDQKATGVVGSVRLKTTYLHCHQYKLKAKPSYLSDKNL
jgi:hypothetical protein